MSQDENARVPLGALLWLATACFAASANFRVVDTMLPAIGDSFGVSAAHASVVVAAYAVTFGLFQLLYGQLGEHYGRLWVVTSAAGAAGIMGIACAFAPSLSALTILRALAGAMAAGIVPVALAFIGDTVPFEKRQAVLARFAFGAMSGQVFGQAAGGMLTAYFGWRYTFACLAALFLAAALALVFEARRRPRPPVTGRLDLVSGTWATVALLKHRNIRALLMLLFVEAAFGMGTFTFVATHLHERFGLGFDHVGLLVMLNAAGALVYFSLAPWLLRRIGQRTLVGVGGAVLGLSYAAAVLADSWVYFIPIILANGLSYYMLHNTFQTYATQMAPDKRGPGMSLFAATLFLSLTVGVSFNGFLYGQFGALPSFTFSAVILPLLGLAMRHQIRRRAFEAPG